MIQILANDKRTLRIMLYIHWVANICPKFLVDYVDPKEAHSKGFLPEGNVWKGESRVGKL